MGSIGKTITDIVHIEFSSIKYYKCNNIKKLYSIRNYFCDPGLGTRVVVDTAFDTRSRKEKKTMRVDA